MRYEIPAENHSVHPKVMDAQHIRCPRCRNDSELLVSGNLVAPYSATVTRGARLEIETGDAHEQIAEVVCRACNTRVVFSEVDELLEKQLDNLYTGILSGAVVPGVS